MKIIHISNSNGRGGASIATTRLNKALLDEKCDSSIWVNYKHGNNPKIKTYPNIFQKKISRIKRMFYLKLIILFCIHHKYFHLLFG